MAFSAGKAAGLAVGALAGVAGLAGAAVATALRRPLPRTSGTLAVAGLRAPVEVIRDEWGVPHLYARSNADLFFAQGYVHAQDRLWQMEFQRRTGHGQLAELFGAIALDSDRFVRVLGFGRIARREAPLLTPEIGEAAGAYCAGVNAFIAGNRRRLPLEFGILRVQPRPWEPADLLVWAKIMALNLSANWTTEIMRARIVAVVGAERADALDPTYPGDHPLAIPAGLRYDPHLGEVALAGVEAVERFTGGGKPGQGSNAWVVGGARTTSGQPLLANDPHLALQMPSLWYAMHLVGGDYEVAGASIPGTAGIVIGHNARIAWGVTNGMHDVQDLYIERFDPADPAGRRYEFQGNWEEAELVREAIAVRERPRSDRMRVETMEVRVTRHGPIVNDLIPPATGANGRDAEQPLAMRWTALEPGTLARSVLAVNRARDWEEFRAALADWTVPTQNFVYADVDGHIGYALGGAVPLRARGDGRVPVPGWTGEWEWTGTIPPAENPHALDPAEGFVVTANNRIAGDDYPHPMEAEWLSGYRAARIRELLTRTMRHDAATFARIHTDRRSLPGIAFADLARTGRLPVAPGNEVAEAARDALAAWDGLLTADSVAGLIYSTLRREVLDRAYAEVVGPLGAVAGLGGFASDPGRTYVARALPRVLALLGGRAPNWLPPGRDPDALLADAWAATVAQLRAEWGDDVSRWRYGAAHHLTLRHVLGGIGPLGRLLNRGPFPTGGDLDTVCMGAMSTSPTGIDAYTAPSYRQILDPADWDNSRAIHPTGQSGHPASRHYADFIPHWLDGTYHPLLWSRLAVVEHAAGHLTLEPAS